jgi:hypothetical protein
MDTKAKALVAIQVFVGATALVGGGALAAAPDGHLLAADPAVLAHTPFADWLVPGVLLAGLVGGGGMLAATVTWRRWPHARALGLLYATGLLSFEVVEYRVIGWQPLQAFEALLAVAMLGLAVAPSGAATRPAGARPATAIMARDTDRTSRV